MLSRLNWSQFERFLRYLSDIELEFKAPPDSDCKTRTFVIQGEKLKAILRVKPRDPSLLSQYYDVSTEEDCISCWKRLFSTLYVDFHVQDGTRPSPPAPSISHSTSIPSLKQRSATPPLPPPSSSAPSQTTPRKNSEIRKSGSFNSGLAAFAAGGEHRESSDNLTSPDFASPTSPAAPTAASHSNFNLSLGFFEMNGPDWQKATSAHAGMMVQFDEKLSSQHELVFQIETEVAVPPSRVGQEHSVITSVSLLQKKLEMEFEAEGKVPATDQRLDSLLPYSLRNINVGSRIHLLDITNTVKVIQPLKITSNSSLLGTENFVSVLLENSHPAHMLNIHSVEMCMITTSSAPPPPPPAFTATSAFSSGFVGSGSGSGSGIPTMIVGDLSSRPLSSDDVLRSIHKSTTQGDSDLQGMFSVFTDQTIFPVTLAPHEQHSVLFTIHPVEASNPAGKTPLTTFSLAAAAAAHHHHQPSTAAMSRHSSISTVPPSLSRQTSIVSVGPTPAGGSGGKRSSTPPPFVEVGGGGISLSVPHVAERKMSETPAPVVSYAPTNFASRGSIFHFKGGTFSTLVVVTWSVRGTTERIDSGHFVKWSRPSTLGLVVFLNAQPRVSSQTFFPVSVTIMNQTSEERELMVLSPLETEPNGVSSEQSAGLLCQEKSLPVGCLKPQHSVNVNLHFFATREGLFKISGLRLRDLTNDEELEFKGSLEILVNDDVVVE